jgi:hypothetical protein
MHNDTPWRSAFVERLAAILMNVIAVTEAACKLRSDFLFQVSGDPQRHHLPCFDLEALTG